MSVLTFIPGGGVGSQKVQLVAPSLPRTMRDVHVYNISYLCIQPVTRYHMIWFHVRLLDHFKSKSSINPFALLTRCNMKDNVAVGILQDRQMVVIFLKLQRHAAVATLVGIGHVMESHPHFIARMTHLQPLRQDVALKRERQIPRT